MLKRAGVLTLLLVWMLDAFAVQGASADNLFKQGLEAHKNGNYAQAVELIRLARDAGLDNEVLAFNLGSALYRMQDYASALREFERIPKASPLHPRAYLSLGLIAVKQQRLSDAREIFAYLQQHDIPQISNMASTMLQRLDKADPPVFGNAFGLLGFSVGLEEKTLDPTTQNPVSTKNNVYLESMLMGSIDIFPLKKNRLQAQAMLYALRNVPSSDYDLVLGSADMEKRFHFFSSYQDIKIGLGGLIMGYRPYSLEPHFEINLGKHIANHFEVSGELSISQHIPVDSQYDEIAGYQHKAELLWQWKFYDNRLRLSYRFEVNQREDLSSSLGYRLYSPTRHRFSVDFSLSRSSVLSPRYVFEWRSSSYAGVGTDSLDREDVRRRHKIVVSLNVSKYLSIVGDVSFIENRSNYETNTYDRTELTAGVDYTFW